MSGRLVRVIPRRGYNFSNLAPGGKAEVTLAQKIDAIDYDKVDLLVRIHQLELGGNGRFEVQIGSDGSTCEEPDHTFGTALDGSIVIDSSTQPGEFKTTQFSGPLGAMLMVVLSAQQDENSQQFLAGEFSIDLVFKP